MDGAPNGISVPRWSLSKPHLMGSRPWASLSGICRLSRGSVSIRRRGCFRFTPSTRRGEIVVAHKLTRSQLGLFFAEMPPCEVAMEACSSAHHWGETLIAFGHEVRSLPPAHVSRTLGVTRRSGGCGGDLRGEVPTRMHRLKFGTLAAHAGVSGRQPADRSGWSWSSIAHKRSDIEPASVKGRMP